MPAWQPVVWHELPPTLASFWTERHLCVLSTLGPRGAPHAVPVGAILDPDEECAWIITRRGSQKVVNLLRDPRLSVTQVDGARWSSLTGTGDVRHDAASIARACDRYASRYRLPSPNPERVAIRITVDRILGSAQVLAGA
jgi:PPOX class probable F420-dependent enzyme